MGETLADTPTVTSPTMSRRIQPVIEEFDDDTDLPLPSRPLPNTGERGAILQSVDSDDEDVSDSGEDVFTRGWTQHPGPASPSNIGAPFGVAQQQPGAPVVTDLTPYKKYVLRSARCRVHAHFSVTSFIWYLFA
jgi:signal recognition particle subunit SRP19